VKPLWQLRRKIAAQLDAAPFERRAGLRAAIDTARAPRIIIEE